MERGLVAALALLLAIPGAHARTPSDHERALALFEEGKVLYERGQFAEAAQRLREAYALEPEPILIYNLARSLESMGELDGALDAYEKYLREATEVKDRPAIEQRVDTLRRQIKEMADERLAREQAERRLAELKNRPRPRRSRAPWYVAGAGGLIAAGGGVTGWLALKRHDQAVSEPVHRRAVELQGQAKDLALASNIMFGVGGATVLAGLAWAIWGSDPEAPPPKLGLSVGPGFVGISGSF